MQAGCSVFSFAKVYFRFELHVRCLFVRQLIPAGWVIEKLTNCSLPRGRVFSSCLLCDPADASVSLGCGKRLSVSLYVVFCAEGRFWLWFNLFVL
ncbi:hypothetical protein CEXT_40411 [Caerostris extrusa]|uniref:Uncharacterized protein n=1 Tax=Caerostris extrusa TaxID=172846 RepID=A0AAV4Y8H0_CAEEX|nr:hypothetical protein CEXT_40411 [Caerostris extrusa]